MIAPARVLALLRKEVAELSRNRSALLPVVVVGFITTALPFFVAIVGPHMTGRTLSGDRELLQTLSKVSGELPGVDRLSPEGAMQAFIFSRFLVMTLLVPVTGAITFAGHSLVGEKLGRSLEPLLATPITMFAEPGVARAMLSPKTALLVLGLGPMTSLLALQVGVLVSARVNDPRTAQQFGALFILPLTGLFMAQMSGAFILSLGLGLTVLAALGVVWLLLLLFGVAIFERETILTRWK
jgi:ABC-2 type transport system permease protein